MSRCEYENVYHRIESEEVNFQVVGYQEGMSLMEQADPLVLLVGLPTIPVFLILGKMVRWEDKVLRLIRASVQKLPFLKYLLPAFR